MTEKSSNKDIAVGSHILRGLGACSSILLARKSKNYKWLFEEKTTLNIILRELYKYQWDALNFVEQTIWKPKYKELLKRIVDEEVIRNRKEIFPS